MTHSRNGSTVVDPSVVSAVMKKIQEEAAAARQKVPDENPPLPDFEPTLPAAAVPNGEANAHFKLEDLNQKLQNLDDNQTDEAGKVPEKKSENSAVPHDDEDLMLRKRNNPSTVDNSITVAENAPAEKTPENEKPVKHHHYGFDHSLHTTEIGKDFSEEMLGMTHEEAMAISHKKVWRNIIFFIYLHIGALYGVYLALTRASWLTLFWGELLVILSGWGITAGAHRLWAHRSYKAAFPLRVVLVILNTIASQNHVIEWSRDHRVHHKFSETDADPHNARRGLFFSHMGWLMVRKHPAVRIRGATVDVSDLEADPLLQFQKRYYVPMMFFWNYAFPGLVAWALWGESFWVAFCICSLLRYCYVLHATWTVNSLAHMYGNRPYDKNINPRENIISNLTSLGEGWHNFHHTFPFDYRASEWNWTINLTTFLLDSCAAVGLVYDRKKVTDVSIGARKEKTGEN